MRKWNRALRLGKIVVVEWLDALAGVPAWTAQEDLDWETLNADRTIISVGTVVRNEGGIVALAQNLHVTYGNVSHIMVIPLSLITSVIELK